jgi:hypothetical protein
MNALHRVRDILDLNGPTFFTLAYRLPAYEGASRIDLDNWVQEMQEQELRAEERKYPPRYIDVSLDEMREKEGRVNGTPRAAFLEEETDYEDRPASLEELRASGPAAPTLGQLAPVFEIVKVTD